LLDSLLQEIKKKMASTDRSGGPRTRLQAKRSANVEASATSPVNSGQVNNSDDVDIVEEVSDEHPVSQIDMSSNSDHELGTKTAILLLLLIFLTSALAMFLVWKTLPPIDPEDQKDLKFPSDIEDAKKLGNVLSRYKEQYYAQVLAGFLCVYIFLQTFAIPGSIFLSIISGFLFPFPVALFSVCFCSATGASFCYLLSYLVGRKLVRHYLPERSAQWSAKVDNHRSNLLSYIMFLRITPFLPNWFINIVSPVIGVPLLPFWVGSFFGVAPPSFIFIQAGTTLQQLTSTMDPITVETVLLLVVFALLSILPVLMKNKLKTKFE